MWSIPLIIRSRIQILSGSGLFLVATPNDSNSQSSLAFQPTLRRFRVGEMADTSEVLEAILEIIHHEHMGIDITDRCASLKGYEWWLCNI